MRSQVFAVLFAIANVSTVFSNLVETQSTDKCNSSTDRVLRRNKSEINRDFAQNAESSEVEERGVSTPAMGMSTSPLKSTNEIDNWLSKKATTDDVFKLLKLDQAADDLLANPKLSTWIDYMKRFNEKNPTKTSVIATLTAHYGDDGVAKIIELSKQVKATAPLARRLQNELIHRWLGAGKSPDDVFTLLTLDKAGSDLFKQPQVVTWAKYLDKFNQENQASKTTLFSFLKLRYKDEAMLVQMLVAAEKVSTTKSIAERVQAEQTRQWLWMEKKLADVFKLLKLDEVGFTLLKEPLFVAWVKYTDEFRMIHFGNKLTTVSVLREHYGDYILAMMLLVAGRHQPTSDIANRLYTEQLRNWEINNFTPEKVFKLLRLDTIDEGAATLFDRPLYSVWASFIGYYGNLRPKEDVSLLTVLLKIYDERELSTILLTAHNENTLSTKNIAKNLLAGQLLRWLAAKRDPSEVFNFLNVQGATVNDVRKKIYHIYRDSFARLPGIKKRKRTPDQNVIPNKKAKRIRDAHLDDGQ